MTGAKAWRVRGERVGGGAADGRVSVDRRGVRLVYTLVHGVGRTTIIPVERGREVVVGGGCGEIRMRHAIAGCSRAPHSLQALPRTMVEVLKVGFSWQVQADRRWGQHSSF